MKNFHGTKAALLYGDSIVTILRDNKPGLLHSGMWELPGGGRESNETPWECIHREIYEELRIDLKPGNILAQREYPSVVVEGGIGYFFAVTVTESDIENIELGNEGQGWKCMSITEFFNHKNVIPEHKERLKDFLGSREF